MAGWSGFRIPEGATEFFLRNVQTGPGAHAACYSLGTGVGGSSGVKRPVRDDHHSPPTSAEVETNRKLYICTSYIASWRGRG